MNLIFYNQFESSPVRLITSFPKRSISLVNCIWFFGGSNTSKFLILTISGDSEGGGARCLPAWRSEINSTSITSGDSDERAGRLEAWPSDRSGTTFEVKAIDADGAGWCQSSKKFCLSMASGAQTFTLSVVLLWKERCIEEIKCDVKTESRGWGAGPIINSQPPFRFTQLACRTSTLF